MRRASREGEGQGTLDFQMPDGSTATVVSPRILPWFVSPVSWLDEGQGRCLDLGCGKGAARAVLEARGYSWLGIDPLPCWTLTRHARGRGEQLPFGSEVFDIVFSQQVLEHVEEPWVVLEEVARVLVPGGWFVGSCSFLEPFHGGASYFNLSHAGLVRLLVRTGFEEIRIAPAINCFPLIARDLVGAILARWVVGISSVLLFRLRESIVRVLPKLSSHRSLAEYRCATALKYAGHLHFWARRRASTRKSP